MSFNIDIAIVILFLIVNLIVGLSSGRGIRTIREYALGNRNFSTATIAATIVATWLGAHSFSITVSETYSQGWYFVIPGLGDAISFFIITYLYAPRMSEFLGKLSVAEAMGSIYGKHIRGITAISGIFPAIGNVAAQFTLFATILTYWLGVSGLYALIISSVIVISYSAFGGIKAVTFTDVIQFFAFGIVMPMLAFLIWSTIDDVEIAFNSLLQDPLFDYKAVFDYHNPNFLDVLFLFLFFMIPGIDSAIFQRISMAKNTRQVSRSFFTAGIFIIICDLIVNTFIGILLKANHSTDLDSNNAIGYIIDNYLNNGFKGFFIIGIMAMIMSTIDSYINSSAVLFSYDFCKAVNIQFSEKKQLLFVRISSLLMGVAALFLSLFSKNLFDLILGTYSFYMPIVSVPFILAIFGFRSTSKAVIIGMIAGFITVIYFKLFSEIDSVLPGMIANIIFFMGSHYLLKEQGGWVGIKDRTPLDTLRLDRKRKFNKFINSIKNFNFIKFYKNNTPAEEKIYVYFGLFCIVIMFSNAYSLPKNLHEQYTTILNPIYCSVLTLSTIFITYPFWIKKFKNKIFISILWNIAVFYNLAFSSSLLVIISQFNQIQVIVLMASLITVAILMHWQVAMLIILSGVIAGIKCYEAYLGVDFLPDSTYSLEFKITYSLLLISTILIAFLKPKQQQQKLTEKKVNHLGKRISHRDEEITKLQDMKNEFLRNLPHEINTPVTGITSMAQGLHAAYDKLTKKQILSYLDDIAKSSIRFDSVTRNITDLSRLSSLTYELNKSDINLSDLVYERLDLCKELYLEDKELEFITNIEDNIIANIDKYYIQQTLDNLIINSINYSSEGVVTITLKKTGQKIEFSIKDDGIGIPQEELRDIFGAFVVSSRTRSPAEGRGIGLALCHKVINVHGGEIAAESDRQKGATFTFILPA